MGTPTHPPSQSSHSHIRIVPREQLRVDHTKVTSPVYRSQSLQFSHFSFSDQASRTGSAVSETSTPNTTFAQMARRSQQGDVEGIEKPASGPVPLSGYITLQPNRNRKNNKNWRTLQPSDLAVSGSPGDFDTDHSSSPIQRLESDPVGKPSLHQNASLHQSSPSSQLKDAPPSLSTIDTDVFRHEEPFSVDTISSTMEQVIWAIPPVKEADTDTISSDTLDRW